MAEEVKMAHPDLRHPFEAKPLHPDGMVTILHGGHATQIKPLPGAEGVWVTAKDLTQINGFEIKPEGACYQELCIPIKQNSDLLQDVDGETFIDLLGFADWLQQPYVGDTEAGVYSFGDIPAVRDNSLHNAMAPEFEVKDRQGNVIRMSDFKGKKALIMTWSSW